MCWCWQLLLLYKGCPCAKLDLLLLSWFRSLSNQTQTALPVLHQQSSGSLCCHLLFIIVFLFIYIFKFISCNFERSFVYRPDLRQYIHLSLDRKDTLIRRPPLSSFHHANTIHTSVDLTCFPCTVIHYHSISLTVTVSADSRSIYAPLLDQLLSRTLVLTLSSHLSHDSAVLGRLPFAPPFVS